MMVASLILLGPNSQSLVQLKRAQLARSDGHVVSRPNPQGPWGTVAQYSCKCEGGLCVGPVALEEE
jgi:hypothetical protein|uniref:Uncharacterized protein n=1 Tax=Oryza sativa subsp. japonica TaxID=39947 RepID=Q5Z581_ORYSJ|nr:hypothetical protein [Oryza sativa Japonica Group]BAD69400.1 hypothetical protein [Oryza sativa Japonica Group]